MTTHDYIQKAIRQLHDVHSSMLNAYLSSQVERKDKPIKSADFAEFRALAQKLEDLSKEYAPDLHYPTWAELTEAWKEREQTNDKN